MIGPHWYRLSPTHLGCVDAWTQKVCSSRPPQVLGTDRGFEQRDNNAHDAIPAQRSNQIRRGRATSIDSLLNADVVSTKVQVEQLALVMHFGSADDGRYAWVKLYEFTQMAAN